MDKKIPINPLEATRYRLKEYLDLCIQDASEEYIKILSDHNASEDHIKSVHKYRNMLLCIKEICKQRNKF